MKILIDADACPVVGIAERIARQRKLPLVLICDTSHVMRSDYARVITVDRGADSADFKLVCEAGRGDVVVTQDYGVAAMALGKGALAIHQSGRWYTQENIDQMLFERHLSKKARRGGKFHGKGPAKRTPEDDGNFEKSFIRLLDLSCEEQGEGPRARDSQARRDQAGEYQDTP